MNAPQTDEMWRIAYKIRHLSIIVWNLISNNDQLQNIRNALFFLRKSLNISQPVDGLTLETWECFFEKPVFDEHSQVHVKCVFHSSTIYSLYPTQILSQKWMNWWKKKKGYLSAIKEDSILNLILLFLYYFQLQTGALTSLSFTVYLVCCFYPLFHSLDLKSNSYLSKSLTHYW